MNIDKSDKTDNFDKSMQHLIATLRQWLDLESPQERYARRCYEAEMEEKRKREKEK